MLFNEFHNIEFRSIGYLFVFSVVSQASRRFMFDDPTQAPYRLTDLLPCYASLRSRLHVRRSHAAFAHRTTINLRALARPAFFIKLFDKTVL